MSHRIEVATKYGFKDVPGDVTRKQIKSALGIDVGSVRTANVYNIDGQLSPEELDRLGNELFADPVVEEYSADSPALADSDWVIQVGYKPGVKDTVGETALSASGMLLGNSSIDGIYTSRLYGISGLSREQAEAIASEVLANEQVENFTVIPGDSLTKGAYIPKVLIPHEPTVGYIDLNVPDERLEEISAEMQLALNLDEMRANRDYYSSPDVIEARKSVGLEAMPTDAELEVPAQTWSEHCKHKIFNAKVTYIDENGEAKEIDSIFKTHIAASTKQLQEELPWVVSVLWDNAGGIDIDGKHLLYIKCETHNSPSNIEPKGGAETGIVGVYRDIIGAGKGGKLLAGIYGFFTGDPDYDGELRPRLHPRRILEGVRLGVEHGGNKHGVPTEYGTVFFHEGYMGKPAIYVAAIGIVPKEIEGEPGHEKTVDPGDLIVMCGGRVGIDGIHGATESSMEAGEWITMGHVQMGDPFTQKKMHDFLLEARDRGLYKFIQDNGAGGLSSSVGESATFSGGFRMDLEKVPLKYAGLKPWQILLSESQERMTLAVYPDRIDEFQELARLHDVEASVLGEFTDTGKFHVVYGDKQVAYLDMDFVHEGVPQMQLTAEWSTPEQRGLKEPELEGIADHNEFLKEMLSRPNIAGKGYIHRQFDHEVQGRSVIKHLVGKESDVYSDASVSRVTLDSMTGFSLADGVNPTYNQIDTYHGTAAAIDETTRRTIAVGGSLEDGIVLNDNFCWPSPIPSDKNPDAEFKMAQLVRSNQALYDYTIAFGTPCVSGKDSMSMDGTIKDEEGNEHRVSALPTVKFLATGRIPDVSKCVTMDVKNPGDAVYILGTTRDELGGSEFYDMHGEIGLNVPKVDAESAKKLYNSLSRAMQEGLARSCHGCYRGGLAVSLAQSSFAGGFGMDVDLGKVPADVDTDDRVLYSESQSRLVVTVSPENQEAFEAAIDGTFAKIGTVTEAPRFTVTGLSGDTIINEDIDTLKHTWQWRYADR